MSSRFKGLPGVIPVLFDEFGGEMGYISAHLATGQELMTAVRVVRDADYRDNLRRLLRMFRKAGGKPFNTVGDILYA
jgi:hypothetical protein